MRTSFFDRVWRNAPVSVSILSLVLVCWACEPPADSSETKSTTTTKSESSSRKPAPVASEEDKQACKDAVESLLKIAANGKNADAAAMLVYRGDDKDREWKSVCDYANEEDQLLVDKTMAKLQVIRSGLKTHDFTEFLTEKEREGVWHVWVTDMRYEDGSEDVKAFAFLKINGSFALGDID